LALGADGLAATGSARLAAAQRKKRDWVLFTYIRTLLALELGDGIIGRSSEATDLNSDYES
jgi:hypothetical protein